MRRYSLEEWRHLGRSLYDVQPKTEPDVFRAEADFINAGGLIVSKVRFTPQLFDRDPSTIKGFDHDYLLFERYDSGSGRGTVGETATQVNAHTLHLVDMGQRYATLTTHVAGIGVMIPYDLIGFDPSRDPSYTSLSRSMPRARLLSHAFDALDMALAGRNAQDTIDLARAFAGLVQRLMLGRSEDSDLQSADATADLALRDYVEHHLTDATLDADHLCDRFGLSRASLYRRFRDDGGVDRYILGRRLDRCFAELCGAPPTRGYVSAVANRWGFTDSGNFSRRFRERFGLSPSDCLAPATTSPSANADRVEAHIVHQWMRGHRQ